MTAVSRVKHGKNYAVNGEAANRISPDLVNGVQELRETFQREKFALQWHENSVRRRKRVNCQKVRDGGQSINTYHIAASDLI